MKNLKENAAMQEMSSEAQKDINGGSITGILIAAGLALVIDQWSDIKQGVSDAWNGI